MLPENACFCDYCGNPQHNVAEHICTDESCYWYSHWTVDRTNPEAVKNALYIRGEIADLNW